MSRRTRIRLTRTLVILALPAFVGRRRRVGRRRCAYSAPYEDLRLKTTP